MVDGDTYTFDLTPSGQGAVSATITTGSFADVDGAGGTLQYNTTPITLSRVYDTVSPTVTINKAAGQADPAGTAPINFTVVFDEPVPSFTAANVTLGGTAPGTRSATISGGPTTYTVAVSGMTGSGTVTATITAKAVTDPAGNSNTASTSTDNSVDFDPVVPVVTGSVLADPSPTNAATAHFTVTFSRNVSGVDATDFTLTTTGVTGAAITNVAGSGTTWIVTVGTGTGSGTVRLNVVDNDTIMDSVNHPLGGAGAGNGNFTSGQVYTIDKIAPQAGGLSAANITTPGSATHPFTVVLSDNLAIDGASLDGSDIRVTGPGGFNQLAVLVGYNPRGNGTPLTATYQISAPGGAWNSADNGTYSLALQPSQVRDTAGNPAAGKTLGTFTVNISSASRQIFLPVVMQPGAPPDTPDLIVSNIKLTPNKTSFKASDPVVIEVTVTNRGTAAAGGFWVDLFINPSAPPTHANVIWNTSCALTPCYGIAWLVPNGLAPGASITLSSTVAPKDYSFWPGHFAAGTTDLYVYADSWNPGVATGAVAESDETNNSIHLGGLTVTGPNPQQIGPAAPVLRSRPRSHER
jgi:CARDB